MGQTQHTMGTANVRASCILLLATGNVGKPGTGANIFRGHTNVQGATDLGLDVVTLPLYYGLAEGAWKHWCRVWEVDYDWMLSRFADKKMMETSGIPSTRWFDATLLPKEQVAQADNLKAMFVMGHGGNTVTRMPEAAKGIEKLDLLVVADPHPTTWAVLLGAQERHATCCRLQPATRPTARARRPTARSSGASRSSSRSSNPRTTTRSCTSWRRSSAFADQDVQEHQGREQPSGRRRTYFARSIAAAGPRVIAVSRRSG